MIDFILPASAVAQDGGAGPGGTPFLPQLMLILSFVLIFYFLLLRPQQKRQKQVQQMLKALKTGDRVLTSGGIYGQILGLKEDVVVLRIADEVKVEVARSAVTQIVPK